ncbi:MAG: 16S rRNA (adenine(1518)-N(6)/adenine(1519)-N(6))-dimethyltransferase RsmA [Deltaproteobacteria bacterium]|nr:16S rRNA (adenine(1518)-N(6)/adenine(1519)-N(6))-dimethyltransferase RsmA [Deltaproteobacteria bacterium]
MTTNPQKILEAAGLQPKHSFGQNFLVDPHHQQKIASLAIACARPAAGPPLVVELGPGLGALTAALLEQGARVIAVERDRDLVPLLKKRFADVDESRLRVVEDNALTWPLTKDNGVDDGFALVGNLPYHHAADLCLRCVDELGRVGGGCFLIQLEVAERIAASPGGKDYGVLSVLLQSRFTVALAHRVPRGAFWPVPDVDGGVLTLTPRADVETDVSFDQLRVIVRAAFQQRRKTLRNALLGGLKATLPGADVDAALAAAAIDPKTRAEQVDGKGFVRLARAFYADRHEVVDVAKTSPPAKRRPLSEADEG